MKKLLYLTLFMFLIYLAYQYRDNIYEIYYENFVSIEDKTTKLVKNDYYRNYSFSYAKNTEDFVPKNKKDILDIYYTIANSGMTEFTFFCPKDYSDCLNDVDDIANDQNTLSNINNFIHPYNSFKTLKTEVYTSGKIEVHIDKVYDEQMIILLNYKVDEIIKNETDENDSIKDKIKKIHDYIINHTSYDKERSDNKIINYKSDNAYGVLIENYGLCGGYTDAMMLFLEKFKLPNYKIATENHVWNYVKIDDEWLHLDLTWDDPLSETGKDILDDSYFLIDDDKLRNLEKDEHVYNADIYAPKNK